MWDILVNLISSQTNKILLLTGISLEWKLKVLKLTYELLRLTMEEEVVKIEIFIASRSVNDTKTISHQILTIIQLERWIFLISSILNNKEISFVWWITAINVKF